MVVLALEFCERYSVLKSISAVYYIFRVFCILVPVLLIVFITIDMYKGLFAQKDKSFVEVIQSSSRRIIAGVIVLLLPSFFKFFVGYINTNFNVDINITTCLSNMNNLDYYKELEVAERANMLRLNTISTVSTVEHETETKKRTVTRVKKTYRRTTTTEGSSVGKRYNLSDSELLFFTRVAQCEQPTDDGVAAEASLFANRYELFGSSYSSLYNYVRNSKWFSCAKDSSLARQTARESAISRVKAVLVLGKRTLPLYVDEHDCINCYGTCSNGNKGDICSITINGNTTSSMSQIKNRNNYVSGKTVLYNRYGGTYTFAKFPCGRCDPFGYTQNAKNKYDSINK